MTCTSRPHRADRGGRGRRPESPRRVSTDIAAQARRGRTQPAHLRGGSRLAQGAAAVETRRPLQYRDRRAGSRGCCIARDAQARGGVRRRRRSSSSTPRAISVKAWGGDGAGYEHAAREHGIHIDYKGFVWLAATICPNQRAARPQARRRRSAASSRRRASSSCRSARATRSKGNADTRNVHRAADAWVYQPTNELFVADGYGNHRVAVFDADTGAFSGCGRVRQRAERRRPPRGRDADDVRGSGPAAVEHRARHPRGEGAPSTSPIAVTGASRCSRRKGSS